MFDDGTDFIWTLAAIAFWLGVLYGLVRFVKWAWVG